LTYSTEIREEQDFPAIIESLSKDGTKEEPETPPQGGKKQSPRDFAKESAAYNSALQSEHPPV